MTRRASGGRWRPTLRQAPVYGAATVRTTAAGNLLHIDNPEPSVPVSYGGDLRIPEGIAFPEQGIPFDGYSGPRWSATAAQHTTFFNYATKARWSAVGGDWIDSALVANGPTAWGTSGSLTPGGERSVSVDITALMSRQKGLGFNRGLMLRSSGSSWDQLYAGRSNLTAAKRPKITLNLRRSDAGLGYTDGLPGTLTIELPCLYSAQIDQSTQLYSNGRDTFMVSSDYRRALLYFDLSNWYSLGWSYDTLDSATLDLTLLSLGGSSNATLAVYELDGPDYTHAGCTGGVFDLGSRATGGIAQNYSNYDQGIQVDPAYYFHDDFSGQLNSQAAGTKYHKGTTEAEKIVDSSLQTTRLRVEWSPTINTQMRMQRYVRNVAPQSNGLMQTSDKINVAHIRYYVEYESDMLPLQNIKQPGIDVRWDYWIPNGSYYLLNGLWYQGDFGNGGSHGDGRRVFNAGAGRYEYRGNSARLKIAERTEPDNPYYHLKHVHLYLYRIGGGSGTGEHYYPLGVVLLPGARYCVEQALNMNTIGAVDGDGNSTVVNQDGRCRIWMNGVLVLDHSGFAQSANNQMGINGFWFDTYHGGTLAPDGIYHAKYDSPVMASSYIGLRKEP